MDFGAFSDGEQSGAGADHTCQSHFIRVNSTPNHPGEQLKSLADRPILLVAGGFPHLAYMSTSALPMKTSTARGDLEMAAWICDPAEQSCSPAQALRALEKEYVFKAKSSACIPAKNIKASTKNPCWDSPAIMEFHEHWSLSGISSNSFPASSTPPVLAYAVIMAL